MNLLHRCAGGECGIVNLPGGRTLSLSHTFGDWLLRLARGERGAHIKWILPNEWSHLLLCARKSHIRHLNAAVEDKKHLSSIQLSLSLLSICISTKTSAAIQFQDIKYIKFWIECAPAVCWMDGNCCCSLCCLHSAPSITQTMNVYELLPHVIFNKCCGQAECTLCRVCLWQGASLMPMGQHPGPFVLASLTCGTMIFIYNPSGTNISNRKLYQFFLHLLLVSKKY